MNLYEFWKFILIFGIFKQIIDFKKEKDMNNIWPTSALRPHETGLVQWQQTDRACRLRDAL
jgi:hypothetical protein